MDIYRENQPHREQDKFKGHLLDNQDHLDNPLLLYHAQV